MLLITKFGGSSVADAQRIDNVARIITDLRKTHTVIPVVSALDGVTELLLDLAGAAGKGDALSTEKLLADITKKHSTVAHELNVLPAINPLLDKMTAVATAVLNLEELTARSQDAIVAFGERLSTAILAARLGDTALDGQQAGIITDDHFTEADPLMELSFHHIRQNLAAAARGSQKVVVSGFIAANQHGVTSTLGRGGSDYTATILGSALSADEIWIYSDVDGLMTADPRIVSNAKLLKHLMFSEAVEMGKFGAKSMHPRALEPAAAFRIPVRMRSTFKPENPGTLISEQGGADGTVVRAVPMLRSMGMLNIAASAMIGRPGSAAEIFQALAAARINIHMICQSVSEAGISIVINANQIDRALAILQQRSSTNPTVPPRTISSTADLAVLAAVGVGMKGTPGVAARLFGAIAKAGMNVQAIAQGSSELSVSVVLSANDAAHAVKAVHDEFGLGV